jgi:hypothetical protein
MKKALGAVVFAAVIAVTNAAPAWARSDSTVTVTCSGGQIVVSDTHSFAGQTTANGMYNQVNPFGEICVVAGT